MAVTVFANTIPQPDKRADIEAAVRAAIGSRPGNRRVEILTRMPERAGFQINILGPELKEWSRNFETSNEEQPEYVQKIIASEL
jgi:hypothetical protein